MIGECAGGVKIGFAACPKCGATEDDTCRFPIPEIPGEREHFNVLMDGPNQFVVWDDRTDDPAPVFPTLEAAHGFVDSCCRAPTPTPEGK